MKKLISRFPLSHDFSFRYIFLQPLFIRPKMEIVRNLMFLSLVKTTILTFSQLRILFHTKIINTILEFGLQTSIPSTSGTLTTSTTGSSSSILPTDPFSEAVVKELVNLGFSREDVSEWKQLCYYVTIDGYAYLHDN